jgi:hypothetical protein
MPGEILLCASGRDSIQDPYGYLPVVTDQGLGYIESFGWGGGGSELSSVKPFSTLRVLSDRAITIPLHCAGIT